MLILGQVLRFARRIQAPPGGDYKKTRPQRAAPGSARSNRWSLYKIKMSVFATCTSRRMSAGAVGPPKQNGRPAPNAKTLSVRPGFAKSPSACLATGAQNHHD